MIMNKKILEGRTFGDVLLVPQYSEVIPRDVNIESKLTKNIKLKLPILSAAMDTVTEDKMAIAMALNGGIGIIHKNLTIEKQASMVKAVKTFKVDKSKYPDASLDANGNVTLVGTGTLKVTATSVWDPTVSNTVTFTINA